LDHGVAEEKILFICVIASAQGLGQIIKHYPKVHIVVGMVCQIPRLKEAEGNRGGDVQGGRTMISSHAKHDVGRPSY
jgi:hypothetical protein